MNSPKHPPRVWIYRAPKGFSREGQMFARSRAIGASGYGDPKETTEYLSLTEHQSLLEQSQVRIRELEEALDKIVNGLSEKGPRVIAAEALAAKGTNE